MPVSGESWPAADAGSLIRNGLAKTVDGVLGDRELEAVAVGDRAAAGGDVDLLDLLGDGLAAQVVALDRAEPGAAQHRPRQEQQEEREEEGDPALD